MNWTNADEAAETEAEEADGVPAWIPMPTQYARAAVSFESESK